MSDREIARELLALIANACESDARTWVGPIPPGRAAAIAKIARALIELLKPDPR